MGGVKIPKERSTSNIDSTIQPPVQTKPGMYPITLANLEDRKTESSNTMVHLINTLRPHWGEPETILAKSVDDESDSSIAPFGAVEGTFIKTDTPTKVAPVKGYVDKIREFAQQQWIDFDNDMKYHPGKTIVCIGGAFIITVGVFHAWKYFTSK